MTKDAQKPDKPDSQSKGDGMQSKSQPQTSATSNNANGNDNKYGVPMD